MHYCVNCFNWEALTNRAYCGHCLSHFYASSKLPLATDLTVRQVTVSDPGPSLAILYTSLGWG